MKEYKSREDVLAKERKQQRQNVNDELYINLARFLGAVMILLATGLLIYHGLRISIGPVILFVMGLAIIVGAALWSADDKKNLTKIREIQDRMADEESEGIRRENFSQYN